MTVELRPLGVRCNLACSYCYQDPQRQLGAQTPPYDLEAMLAAVDAAGQPFSLFGGEPLLVPLADLER
ncbi:MAG: 4Fe-4S cluster-binding domain-containing protein, partial [Myxococcales bacterium]|nr:4Fe-4S cluster-binding domain-containing protein [Myxococcales bacterium]